MPTLSLAAFQLPLYFSLFILALAICSPSSLSGFFSTSLDSILSTNSLDFLRERFASALSDPALAPKQHDCKCFPGDSCWPSHQEWATFNHSVGGRLVPTVPIASVCHENSSTGYDKEKCDALINIWGLPDTHIPSSSSIMSPYFANMSCDPFLPPDAQCVVGSYVQYAVNASSASDYKKTLDFAHRRNIRLVVRNTGHDYYGKSTGAGALAIWTHHLKSIEHLDYRSAFYTGPAMKVGAGVEDLEAYNAAKAKGRVVVGGNCPTVGIAGGYTMGGGHGPLAAPNLGLAADSVLEWEVVTGAGEHIIATPLENKDLYWAMTGGGGSTYAVALSATFRTHPDKPTAASTLTFGSAGVAEKDYWDVVQTFIGNLPSLLDSNTVSIWLVIPGMFLMTPTTAPGQSIQALESRFDVVTTKLKQSNMTYNFDTQLYPSFVDSYLAKNQPFPNISDYTMGGRLIQRSTVENRLPELTAAIKSIVDDGGVLSGVSFYAPGKVGDVPNSVNPAMRNSVFDAVLGLPYSATDNSRNLINQHTITDKYMPMLEKLTPGGGSYLSEADFRQPDFQQAFYGSHYSALRDIKRRYDPHDIFYALTGVGSDEWTTDNKDGRLCRVG